MEDLTTGAAPRCQDEQLRDLAAIGIDHDGPVVAQSGRTHLYDAAIERLERAGATYPCFCTRADIRDAAAAPHGPSLDGGYPGTCRDLSGDEVAERRRRGTPSALRLRSPVASVRVVDRLVGEVTLAVDDMVLRRKDGVAAYNLAVVVDDADQGVDQVVRGDDLLHTTGRQVVVQRLLGLATPEYVHVPLVHGPDGERLAKRHGSISLSSRLALGDDVADVVGALAASMGLARDDEAMTAARVLERFDPDRLALSHDLPAGVWRARSGGS